MPLSRGLQSELKMKKSQSETRKETKNHWHTVLVRNFVA